MPPAIEAGPALTAAAMAVPLEPAIVAPETVPVPTLVAAPPPAPTRRARREPAPTPSVGFPWEVSPLASVPMADLLAEVDRRRRRAAAIVRKCERLRDEIARIDGELAGMREEGPAEEAGPGPRAAERLRVLRAENAVTLSDAIAMAVEVRASVTPAEAAKLVLANGYRTASKTFGVAVATTLAKHPGFKRLGRGRYQNVR